MSLALKKLGLRNWLLWLLSNLRLSFFNALPIFSDLPCISEQRVNILLVVIVKSELFREHAILLLHKQIVHKISSR